MKNVAISIRARLLNHSRSAGESYNDVMWLSKHQIFTGEMIGRAIVATFSRRGTEIPASLPLALTADFGDNPAKVAQWNAFIRKGKLDAPSFPNVIARIRNFLAPVMLQHAEFTAKNWHPETGWT